MLDREQDHVAAGWDGAFRWIEAGNVRLAEDDKSAFVTIQARPDPTLLSEGFPSEGIASMAIETRLSATELLGLVRHLAAWFDDDPTDTIQQIETCATYVQTELEAWNARARIDEEHPPYDKLTNALDTLIGKCRDLREALGKFTEGEK